MNDLLNMTILGIVQGLTEFLPVSSSGHLVLAQNLLGFKAMSGLGVELLLHGGTVLAVLVYYRRLIGEILGGLVRREADAWRFAGAILLSMIPAGLLGILCEDQLEAASEHPAFVCAMLCLTGLLLLASRLVCRPLTRSVGPIGALTMGVAQAVAMLPGVSRSGSTLAASRFLGIDSDKAAAFSFLMVVPLILGGNLLHLLKALDGPSDGIFSGITWQTGLVGFAVSAVVGYASVAWMVRLLGKRHFWRFGIYCLTVGLGGLLWFALR